MDTFREFLLKEVNKAAEAARTQEKSVSDQPMSQEPVVKQKS